MTAPPRPPSLRRRLSFPPRRVAAILMLTALPGASALGAFSARTQRSARAEDLMVEVGFPARTLYRADETIDISVSAPRGCAELAIDGLAPYLAAFQQVRTVPAPPSASRSFRGSLNPGERLSVQIQGSPVALGHARGSVRVTCDGARTEIDLTTLVFP